jgi:hypothetical protein
MALPLTSDLAVFFDTNDFGVTATVGGTSFTVILDKIYVEQAVGTVGIEGSNPVAICRSSDVSSVVHNTAITVDSISYTVVGVEPDNTGVTLLVLEAA